MDSPAGITTALADLMPAWTAVSALPMGRVTLWAPWPGRLGFHCIDRTHSGWDAHHPPHALGLRDRAPLMHSPDQRATGQVLPPAPLTTP